MQARRTPVVATIAILAIAAATVPAVVDTFETGRVYLFSREFLEDLPARFRGTGRFRFLLQPTLAIALGVRGGLADARAGHPPYLFGLAFSSERRKELLRSGLEAVGTLLAMGILLDLVFQLVLYRAVHPGAALVIGPILICAPYAISRALTTRVATRRRGSEGEVTR